mgnify:CR=1 FL=1|tara:strand:+ start:383 stop:1078 length:696 start_codon:yes stop_codon:yes gene_type:complete
MKWSGWDVVRWVPWSTIKNIGNSSVATVLLVIPVFGYLIIFSDSILELFQFPFDGKDSAEMAEPATNGIAILTETNMKIAYIGMWFLGAATIAYRVFCPAEIRSSKDEADFIASKIGLANRAYYELLIEDLVARKWYDPAVRGLSAARQLEHHSQTNSRSGEARGAGELLRQGWLEKNFDGLALGNGCAYRRADYRFLPLRFVIVVAYIAGFVTTMIPSIRTLFNVVETVF